MKTSMQNQQGAVLIVALVFLLLTAMISATVMQTSILEMKMAGNEQMREESFQRVQAIANAIAADTTNLVIAGDVGYKICATGASGCNSTTINLAADVVDVPTGVTLDYYAERQAPLFAPMPFRLGENAAGSATAYQAAIFEIDATYDGTSANLGRARIAQGIAMRVAASSQ